jgi:hypothetical protein
MVKRKQQPSGAGPSTYMESDSAGASQDASGSIPSGQPAHGSATLPGPRGGRKLTAYHYPAILASGKCEHDSSNCAGVIPEGKWEQTQ